MKDKVVQNNSQVKIKLKDVEDHHRISSISNKTKFVTACNDSLNSRTSYVNAVCVTCGKCVFNSNPDACVSMFLNDVNARTKKPQTVAINDRKPIRNVNQSVTTPPRKQLLHNLLSRNLEAILGCFMRIQIVQIILFIVDFGCTKHMTGNLKLLCNFVEKYLGTVKESSRKGQNRIKTKQKREAWQSREMLNAVTVDRARKTEENKKRMNENTYTSKKLFKIKETRKEKGPNLQILQIRFDNDQFALILGYENLVQGNTTIKSVYYVEGLKHNLFSVGQFCDADLEVTFRKSTCFVRDLQGNDLLSDNRGSDLYIITLQDLVSPTPICFLAKASLTQAWL
nr:integrase, catalytic region, zinc finger, CCHC-type, peptidase aspartic, catalytic [Tanacetum cinerariifolium]